MWNPKKELTVRTTQENTEDCGCSTSSMETVKSVQMSASTADVNVNANIQQENNLLPSNKLPSTIDNKVAEDDETFDSGILSGHCDNSDASALEEKQLNTNIPVESFSKHSTGKHHENYDKDNFEDVQIFDSGCIDEEDDIATIKTVKTIDGKIPNNDVNQNQNITSTDEHNNDRLTQSSVKTAAARTTVKSESENSQMLFKHNAEAGMLQGFCNLSLQEVNSNQSANNSNQLLTGVQINDLNVTKKSSVTSSARQQQNDLINDISASTIPNLRPSTVVPAINNWQQFYNQDDDGNTPLHLACFWGEKDVVAAIIRLTPHPYLLNIPNDAAQTPLHIATLSQQPIIMRMLLIAGAMPNLRDSHGNTALHLACKIENEECVQALTAPITSYEMNEFERNYRINCQSYARLPSDLDIRNYDGENCVHLAAQSGQVNILRTLVLSGADINVREGKAGHTCLHMAIKNSNETIANFLIMECEKLDLEVPTYARLTAYQLAKFLNRVQIIQLLEKHGAKLLSPPESDSDYSDNDMDAEDNLFSNCFGDPGYFVNFQGPNNAMPVA